MKTKTTDAVLARLHANLNEQLRLFNQELKKAHTKAEIDLEDGVLKVKNIGRDWSPVRDEIDITIQLMVQPGDQYVFQYPETVLDCNAKVMHAYLRNIIKVHHGLAGGKFTLSTVENGVLVTRIAE